MLPTGRPRHRLALASLLAILGMVVLAGCGATGPSATTATGSAEIRTSADPDYIVPAAVPPGATVRVLNQHSSMHDVTADDATFHTRLLRQDESDIFTAPQQPGSYPFHCSKHPNLRGTLIVAP
ncbi:cupredoxin domain-containing protein [Nocardia sp. R16R-3T]